MNITELLSRKLFKAIFRVIIDLPEPLLPPKSTSSSKPKPPFAASKSVLRPLGNITKLSS